MFGSGSDRIFYFAAVAEPRESRTPSITDSSALAFINLIRQKRSDEVCLISLTTTVVWLGILTAGVIGLALPPTLPTAPAKQAEIQAELVHVDLRRDSLPSLSSSRPTHPSFRLPPAQHTPPAPAVAEPTPAIQFALPVAGPVRIVEVAQADYHQPATPTDQSASTVNISTATANTGHAGSETLVMGIGDGKQPAPHYPRRAILEGQEGTVVVRFSVNENGWVCSAEAIRACSWPLLNNEAVRTVRERWHFRPGTARLYEVSIRFHLE